MSEMSLYGDLLGEHEFNATDGWLVLELCESEVESESSWGVRNMRKKHKLKNGHKLSNYKYKVLLIKVKCYNSYDRPRD